MIIKLLYIVLTLYAFIRRTFMLSLNNGMDTTEVVLSLMGICATLIVGVSVYDAVSLRSLLHDYDIKIQRLEDKIRKADELERNYHKTKRQLTILLHFTWGLSFSDKQPYTALKEYWNAIMKAAEADDIKRAKSCITNAECVLEDINRKRANQIEVDDSDINAVPTCLPEKLKRSKVYCAFEEQIIALINNINQSKNDKSQHT